jgi:hypothetical protein
MSPQDAIHHYQILTSLLAPALLMAATGSLLVSANNRLARVVDRLRSLVALYNAAGTTRRHGLDQQIARHRRRSRWPKKRSGRRSRATRAADPQALPPSLPMNLR